MHSASKILGSLLACLFSALLLLQVSTGFFEPHNEMHFSRPRQAPPLMQQRKATTVIIGGQGGVGRIPDQTLAPVVCNSGITSTPADFLKLLAPGWTVNSLGALYRNETQPILCYDNWNTAWNVPGGTWLNTADFLKTMGWPSDLFDKQAGTHILILSGPDILKPNTPTGTNTNNPSNLTCKWQPDLGLIKPDIDMCAFATTVLKAVVLTPLKWAITATTSDTTGNDNGFFWTTPAKLTYANPDLATFWNISLAVVNTLLVLSIAWTGFSYLTSIGSWQMRAQVIEILPRIILALLAAYLSARICQMAIDGSNVLSSIWDKNVMAFIQDDPQQLFPLFCQIIMCILILLLILEEVIRYTLLFVLIGFGPLWAFSGAFRETQGIFKGAIRLLLAATLLQPAQVAVLDLGQTLTKDLGGNAGTPLYYLVSIALMIFVLQMMAWFLGAGGGISTASVEAAGIGAAVFIGRTIGRGERRITHHEESRSSRKDKETKRRETHRRQTHSSNTDNSNTSQGNHHQNHHRKRKHLPPYVVTSRGAQQARKDHS